MLKQIRTIIALTVMVAFAGSSIQSPAYAQMAQDPMPFMPKPGVMVQLSPEYTPAYLKGIVIHPENALKFDFIINRGDKELTEDQKKDEYTKLTKYFLASLAIPDDDQWVNLSPYEKDRIIKDDFGKTEMGRDLLAQDYMLKQITASLIYPEDSIGKKFWDKVYTQAQQQFGTTNIPVNTFNKVWILPDDALIYEKGNTAYVLRNHLKVMLEEDYLSLQKHTGIQSAPMDSRTHTIASRIVKEIVLPELEREVNEDKNFTAVRQVYSGMLLAAWYKRALKESFLSQIYANKAKVKGVDQDPKTNEQIYRQYLKAYKKGVFNFIKEDVDKYTNEIIPRKYFSGGFEAYKDFAQIVKITDSPVALAEAQGQLGGDDLAMVNLEEPTNAAMTAGVYMNIRDMAASERESWHSIIGKKFRITLNNNNGVVVLQITRISSTELTGITSTGAPNTIYGFKEAKLEKADAAMAALDKILAKPKSQQQTVLGAMSMKDLDKSYDALSSAIKQKLGRRTPKPDVSRERALQQLVFFNLLAKNPDFKGMFEIGSKGQKALIELDLVPNSNQGYQKLKDAVELLKLKQALRPLDEGLRSYVVENVLNLILRTDAAMLSSKFNRIPDQYLPDAVSAQNGQQLAEHLIRYISPNADISSADKEIGSRDGFVLRELKLPGRVKAKDLSAVIRALGNELRNSDISGMTGEAIIHWLYMLKLTRPVEGSAVKEIDVSQQGVQHTYSPEEFVKNINFTIGHGYKIYLNPAGIATVTKKGLITGRDESGTYIAGKSLGLRNNTAWFTFIDITGSNINDNVLPVHIVRIVEESEGTIIRDMADRFLGSLGEIKRNPAIHNPLDQVREMLLNRKFYATEETVGIVFARSVEALYLKLTGSHNFKGLTSSFSFQPTGKEEELVLAERTVTLLEYSITDAAMKVSAADIEGMGTEDLFVSGVLKQILEKLSIDKKDPRYLETRLRFFMYYNWHYRKSDTAYADYSKQNLTVYLQNDLGKVPEDAKKIVNDFTLSIQQRPSENTRLEGRSKFDAAMTVLDENGKPLSPKDLEARKLGAKKLAVVAYNAQRNKPQTSDLGGIDMNSANLSLQIKRDGLGVPLPLAQQDMAKLSRIQGFEPVIVEIRPASQTPLFSQMQANP